MKRQTGYALLITLGLALVAVAATPLLATEPSPDAPDTSAEPGRHGQGRAHGELTRLHLGLGRYYLLDGQLDRARDHFMAVATMMGPQSAEEPPSSDGEISSEEGSERRHRDHRGGRRGHDGMRARIQGYLMAAVATELMGDEAGAMALAEEGQALLPPPRPQAIEGSEEGERRHGRRDRDPFEAFLSDPAGFSERFAGGADAAEARILELEAGLSDNDGQ